MNLPSFAKRSIHFSSLLFKSGYSGHGSVPGYFFFLLEKIREIAIFQDLKNYIKQN